MKTSLIFIFSFCIFNSSFSQSWQWGIRGGSGSSYEEVIDMATDNGGNVYILAHVDGDASPTVSGYPQTTGGYGQQDILVVSYSCSGAFRWKKTIGGYFYDIARAICLDTLGHVYVLGEAHQAAYFPPPLNQPNPIHYDTDYTQPFSNQKNLFLVQYDTAGTFKWLRQPAPDSTAASDSNYLRFHGEDLIVNKNGEIEMLCFLSPGLISGSTTLRADSARPYILKYNSAGDVTGLLKPEMYFSSCSGCFRNIRMLQTSNGKYIISGTRDQGNPQFPFFIANQRIAHTMFVACFDSQWQYLWKRENSNSMYGALSYRPVVKDNHILIGGSVSTTSNVDSFNNYPFINSLSSGGVPFMVVLDSNGNNIWAKNASANATSNGYAVSYGLGGNAVITGSYPGLLIWDSFIYSNPPNTGYDIFLTGFDAATGAFASADSLKGSAYGDGSSALIADEKDNLYLGGYFGADLHVGANTLTPPGFFAAKYGNSNCGTLTPLKLTTFTATLKDKDVQLQWQTAQEQNTSNFNIQRSTNGREFTNIGMQKAAGNSNTPQSYIYIDNSPFTIHHSLYYRLQMVDKDGSYTYSSTVFVKLPSQDGIVVYPNPVKDILHVQQESTSFINQMVQVTDIQGKVLQQQNVFTNIGITSFDINTSQLIKGIYLLLLNGTEKKVVKFVKD